MDQLVDVPNGVVSDGAGRVSTALRSSWLGDQEKIRRDGGYAQVVSAAWWAPDEFWANVGPDRE